MVWYKMETDATWTIFDVYCGLGGFTSGALQAFNDNGISNIRVIGLDSDKTPLAAFKLNVAATGVADVQTICKIVGTDTIEWPEETDRLIIHFSPCCQPFSKARSSPPTLGDVDNGLNQITLILDLVVSMGYKRWSLEEVSNPRVVALVQDYATKYPSVVAFEVIDAVSYGCPSERRRLIATHPKVLEDLKSNTTTAFRPPKRAFEEYGIEPASEFYRNGNTSCVPRPISRPGFTVTASHPLVFCHRDRSLVRCMRPSESAALVGFCKKWTLPSGVGAAQRSVGNAVSPMLSRAIVGSELRVRFPGQATIAEAKSNGDEFVSRAEVEAMIASAIAAYRKTL